MLRLRFASALVAAAVFTVSPACSEQARAQTETVSPAVAVEEMVARALARAPSVAARESRIDAAESALEAADALPDPMVEFEYRAAGFPRYTIGTEPGSMLGTSFRQNLLSRGRRDARKAVAGAEIAQSRADLTFWATTLATSVRTLYARLYAIDRERVTLEDARELLAMLEATATARYAAGESDQASVLRVQLERSRLGERMADLRNDRVSVQAALNRLMNEPAETPIGMAGRLPDAAATPAVSAEHLPIDASPEIALRRAEIAVAAERVHEAKQELGPSWSVAAGLFWQGGLDRMATVSVGVELPFWKSRKQLPLVAATEQRQRAAELDLADSSAELRAELLRLVEARTTAEEQIVRYQSAMLPQNSAALDATRTSYLVGRGDFVAVLEEFRNWIEIRVGLARRQADQYTAQVRIDAIIGAHDGAEVTK